MKVLKKKTFKIIKSRYETLLQNISNCVEN